MKKSTSWYFAGVLALAMVARAVAGVINYQATLVSTPALAYNATYVVNLPANGIDALSAQAVYSSATVPNATFQDGSQSTGSFTVGSYAALSSASAVDNITVLSTSGLTNAQINFPGYVFTNGLDWATGATTHDTAVSLGAALAKVPYLAVSVSGSVVYATAPAGSLYNSYPLLTNNSSVTVATPNFAGGQDNAVLRINGVPLQQNLNWTAATSNAATASSIASAINASSALNGVLHASASGAVVTATSTLNGAVYNYRLQSSTPTALTASASSMVSGSDAGFALGSGVFTATNGSGLTTALPVLYTSGTLAIGGLTNQTTYYAVPVSGNSFLLAKYSTSAVVGNVDLVVVTSTNTQLAGSKHTYTLAPLAISGTPGLAWSVSNDGTNWTDLAVSSVTINPQVPGNTTWAFGYIGTKFLRLSATAPTTGGEALTVNLIGTN